MVQQKTSDASRDPFVRWLQREKVPLFWHGGIAWRAYHRSLIPAALKPTPVDLSVSSARELLRESRASLVRWHTRTFEEPSSYWFVVCENYAFNALGRKIRNQIRKANRECSIRRLDAEWAATNSYDCYAAAFGRYRNGRPTSRMEYESTQRSCVGGPFEYWGAFVGNHLAGLAKCVVTSDYVAVVAFKFDPAYGRSLPSYALIDALLETYVRQDKKALGNGFLSLHHETQMQDFLLKFGFRRVYCDLQIAYRPALRLAVNVCFPFRRLLARLASPGLVAPVQSLLRQEEVRRSCLAVGGRQPHAPVTKRETLLAPKALNESMLMGGRKNDRSQYDVFSASRENPARHHDQWG